MFFSVAQENTKLTSQISKYIAHIQHIYTAYMYMHICIAYISIYHVALQRVVRQPNSVQIAKANTVPAPHHKAHSYQLIARIAYMKVYHVAFQNAVRQRNSNHIAKTKYSSPLP